MKTTLKGGSCTHWNVECMQRKHQKYCLKCRTVGINNLQSTINVTHNYIGSKLGSKWLPCLALLPDNLSRKMPWHVRSNRSSFHRCSIHLKICRTSLDSRMLVAKEAKRCHIDVNLHIILQCNMAIWKDNDVIMHCNDVFAKKMTSS